MHCKLMESGQPEWCGKCGDRMGPKSDYAWKYRSCWAYGIKKLGEGGPGTGMV